jgi:hypothetical protein
VSCEPVSVLRPSEDDKMVCIGGVGDEMREPCESKEGEEVELSSEDEAGERKTKKLLDLRKPNQEAIDEHERTHLPTETGAAIVSKDEERRPSTERRRISRRCRSSTSISGSSETKVARARPCRSWWSGSG